MTMTCCEASAPQRKNKGSDLLHRVAPNYGNVAYLRRLCLHDNRYQKGTSVAGTVGVLVQAFLMMVP